MGEKLITYAIISLGLPSNGRRLALLAEGDQKPSVDIEICVAEIEAKEGDRIMTTYEVISIILGILALLVSILGIIVKLIIEIINAKK